ncbi:MAG: FUSC family protein, partial [Solirubrobacteraceae bacterium]|nr:FUSC family protein [Solirubrobacteraceae bacterium]
MDTRGEMGQAEQVADEVFRVADHEIDWSIAVAGMFAVALPLLTGLALGEATLGLLGALGGLNVALVVPGREVSDRWSWGLLCLVGSVVAIALADITQPSIAASVVATFVWTSAWSTLRVAGKHGALTGFALGAVFIITNGLPAQPLGQAAAAVAVGGTVALVLMLIAGGGPVPKQGEETWPGIGATLSTVWSRFAISPVLRHHALRIGLTTAASVLAYRLIDLTYGYWVTLTILAILQPDPHASRIRSIQRSTGSLVGITVAAVFVYLTGDPWVLAAAASLMALGLFATRERSYHWLVMLLTPTALLMISSVFYSGIGIAGYRVLNTVLGILIALAATW